MSHRFFSFEKRIKEEQNTKKNVRRGTTREVKPCHGTWVVQNVTATWKIAWSMTVGVIDITRDLIH